METTLSSRGSEASIFQRVASKQVTSAASQAAWLLQENWDEISESSASDQAYTATFRLYAPPFSSNVWIMKKSTSCKGENIKV